MEIRGAEWLLPSYSDLENGEGLSELLHKGLKVTRSPGLSSQAAVFGECYFL